MKLIQLSDTHYIVVDDSEIKQSDVMYDIDGDIGIAIGKDKSQWEGNMKIIYSFGKELEGVINKSLSEIEEAIYGYSVEKMAESKYTYKLSSNARKKGFIEGFKAHQELTKDKLFTIKDMREAFKEGLLYTTHKHYHDYSEDLYIQSLLPKTEWEVEFDEQGKIKLI